MVESDWRPINPSLMPIFFPNTSNQNFDIAILFNVVESSGNYVFEDDESRDDPIDPTSTIPLRIPIRTLFLKTPTSTPNMVIESLGRKIT
jgi:hypothetical protein